MRIGCFGLAVLAMSGCVMTGPGGDGDDGVVETAEVSSAITVVPEQGFWFYDETQITTNCNLPVPRTVSGTFFIDVLTTTSYRVFPGDGASSFLCGLNNASFSCPNRLVAQDAILVDNAVLTFTVSVLGAYSDSRHGLGKQDVAVACTGSGCSTVGVPCGFVRNFAVIKL